MTTLGCTLVIAAALLGKVDAVEEWEATDASYPAMEVAHHFEADEAGIVRYARSTLIFWDYVVEEDGRARLRPCYKQHLWSRWHDGRPPTVRRVGETHVEVETMEIFSASPQPEEPTYCTWRKRRFRCPRLWESQSLVYRPAGITVDEITHHEQDQYGQPTPRVPGRGQPRSYKDFDE